MNLAKTEDINKDRFQHLVDTNAKSKMENKLDSSIAKLEYHVMANQESMPQEVVN